MDAFLPNFNTAEPDPTKAPSVPEIRPSDPAPLAKPLTNMQGETISPELLVELKAYIEQTVVSTVSQAITTVIPDVVETTLAQQQQQQQQNAIAQPKTPAAYRDDFDDYTPGQYQGRRPVEARQDRIGLIAAWGAVAAIVAVMGGVIAFTSTQSPQTKTQQQNQQLTNQLTQQSEQLLESNQQILESKQRCGNFSLICNIKE